MFRSNKHDVTWILFKIKRRNPNFLNYCTPGPINALLTVLENVERVEIILYSVSVMLGGFKYVQITDRVLLNTVEWKGLVSLLV